MKGNRRSILTGTAALALFAGGIAGGLALHGGSSSGSAGPARSGKAAREAGDSRSGRRGPRPASRERQWSEYRAERNLLARGRLLREMMGGLTAAQCERMMEEARGDERAMIQVAARWAELDPSGLFAYVAEGEGRAFAQTERVLEVLFAAWAKSDPNGAFAAVRATPSFKFSERCTMELVGHLLYSDPGKAMDLVRASVASGDEVLGSFTKFADWSDHDRAGAAELLMTLPRCKFRLRLATALCRRWGESDPEAAVQFAERLDSQARERSIENAVAGWLKKDFAAAREYIEEAGGSVQARLGGAVVGELTARDPAEAYRWIDEHLEGATRRGAIATMVQDGASRHPATVAQLAEKLPVGDLKQSALKTASRAWFEADPEAAAAWLTGIDSGFARKAGLQGLRQARMPAATRAELLERIEKKSGAR